jgi:hypothetical protein
MIENVEIMWTHQRMQRVRIVTWLSSSGALARSIDDTLRYLAAYPMPVLDVGLRVTVLSHVVCVDIADFFAVPATLGNLTPAQSTLSSWRCVSSIAAWQPPYRPTVQHHPFHFHSRSCQSYLHQKRSCPLAHHLSLPPEVVRPC